MSDLLDGPIDDVFDVSDGEEPPQSAALILIEYRTRGVSAPLVATVVVVIAALAITSHRRLTVPQAFRVGSIARPQPAPVHPKSRQTVVESSDVPQTRPTERAATPDPAPDMQPALAAAPAITADLTVSGDSTADEEAADAPPTSHDVAVAEVAVAAPAIAPPSPPDPGPSAEEVEREILREAEDRKAEFEEMQRLKPEVQLAKERERPQRLLEERIEFRKKLRAILEDGGRDAGRKIAEVRDQYGTRISNEHWDIVELYLQRFPYLATYPRRVTVLRALNVPEPRILKDRESYLNRQFRNARNGLRDADEVRVKAAADILKVPVASHSVGGSP